MIALNETVAIENYKILIMCIVCLFLHRIYVALKRQLLKIKVFRTLNFYTKALFVFLLFNPIYSTYKGKRYWQAKPRLLVWLFFYAFLAIPIIVRYGVEKGCRDYNDFLFEDYKDNVVTQNEKVKNNFSNKLHILISILSN